MVCGVEDRDGARPARAGDRRAAPEEARQAQAPQPRAHRQVLRVASPEVKALTSPSLLLLLFSFGSAAVGVCGNSPSPPFFLHDPPPPAFIRGCGLGAMPPLPSPLSPAAAAWERHHPSPPGLLLRWRPAEADQGLPCPDPAFS